MLNVECFEPVGTPVTVADAVLAERCGRLHWAFRGVWFMGSCHVLAHMRTGPERARTRDEDEDEDERLLVPCSAFRIPESALGRFMGSEHLQNPTVSSVHARWLRAVRAFGQTFNVQRSTSNVQLPRPLNVEC